MTPLRRLPCRVHPPRRDRGDRPAESPAAVRPAVPRGRAHPARDRRRPPPSRRRGRRARRAPHVGLQLELPPPPALRRPRRRPLPGRRPLARRPAGLLPVRPGALPPLPHALPGRPPPRLRQGPPALRRRPRPAGRTGRLPGVSPAPAQQRLGGVRQAPFDGPARVLDYLGRYTHRVAISNERILSVDGREIRFRWKDYRRQHRWKTMPRFPPTSSSGASCFTRCRRASTASGASDFWPAPGASSAWPCAGGCWTCPRSTGLKHNRGFFGLRGKIPPTQRPRRDRCARSTLPRALLGCTGSGPGWH